MFACDFLILTFLISKIVVLAVVSLFKRNIDLIKRYCHRFELFLGIVSIFSIPLFVLCETISFQLNKKEDNVEDQRSHNFPNFFYSDSSIDKVVHLLIVMSIVLGIFLVHFSPKYPLNYYNDENTFNKCKNCRREKLENKGYVLLSNEPFIFMHKFAAPSRPIVTQPACLNDEDGLPVLSRPVLNELDGESCNPNLTLCADCCLSKRDLIMKPCLHFELCVDCFSSKYKVLNVCPICKEVV